MNDFGKALVILGGRDEADGNAWHVPNDQPRITQGEMLGMFAEEAGMPLKMTSVGAGMLPFAGLFPIPAKELIEMMYEFEKPFIVDSSRFEKAFGRKPTPMKEAIRETVARYKNHSEEKKSYLTSWAVRLAGSIFEVDLGKRSRICSISRS